MANKRIMQALIGAAAMVSASSANAVRARTATYFDFNGTCTDCSGVGKGVLVLNNYTYGSQIDASNFLSFQYNGSDLQNPFLISDPTSLSGSISGPGTTTDFVYLNDDTHYFFSGKDGFWSLGNGGIAADYGTNGTFSTNVLAAAPEPSTWALMILGLGAIGFAARRRRSVTTRVRFA